VEENGLGVSDRENGVLDHLKNKETWLRLVFMLLFGIVFQIVKSIVFLVAIVQFLFTLLTGKAHGRIKVLALGLATYLRETTEFLTFVTEQKPYPWADWPSDPEAGAEKTASKAPKTSVAKGTRTGKKSSAPGKPKKTGGDEKV